MYQMFATSPMWGEVLALQVFQLPCTGCGQHHIDPHVGLLNLAHWPAFTGRSPSPEAQALEFMIP
jgi:hypothetical protein